MTVAMLLDHLIRPRQHRRWDVAGDRLRGVEVDDELKPGRVLDGQVFYFRACEDLILVDRGLTSQFPSVRPIRHQAARVGILPSPGNPREPMPRRKLCQTS